MDDGLAHLPEGVREGEDLAGKYRVGAIIGTGAMGIVVAARHKLLDQKVAIKFLHTDLREQPNGVSRFVQEAQAAMSIQSEHVVRLRDIAMLDTGEPYIIMEYLEGSDLSTRLRTAGSFAVTEAVDYVLEACEAIAEAHCLGIIHRDLKPANLFLVERPGAMPTIKVLDFGVSKTTEILRSSKLDEESGEMTGPKAVLGSPFYMSPEQMVSARDVDERTDIWALGVTLYQLITGKVPYMGNSLVQVYAKITARGPHKWKDALRDTPAGLEVVLAKCLARDRSRRYPSIADLARALKPFGSARAEVSVLRIKQTLVGKGAVQTSTLDPHVLRPVEAVNDGDAQVPSAPTLRVWAPHRRRLMVGRLAAIAAVAMVAASLVRWGGIEVRRRSTAALVVEPSKRLPMDRAWVSPEAPFQARAERQPKARPKARGPRSAKPKRSAPAALSRVVSY